MSELDDLPRRIQNAIAAMQYTQENGICHAEEDLDTVCAELLRLSSRVKKLERENQTLRLEQTLEALARFGSPAISKLAYGWCCRVDLFVPAAGTKVQVQSETLPIPAQAATQCYERVLALNPKPQPQPDGTDE